MPVIVTVQPFFTAYDPFARFTTPEQREVLQRFQAGAHLRVWRFTCPENWMVVDPDGGNETQIAGKDMEPDMGYCFGTVSSLAFLGKSGGTGDGVITHSMRSRDIGQAGSEWWLYDAEKAGKLHAEWESFLVARAAWNEAALPPALDLAALSPRALALLRTLQREGVPPYPELAAEFEELRLQGLLHYAESGLMKLQPNWCPSEMRVPRGLSVSIQQAKPSKGAQ